MDIGESKICIVCLYTGDPGELMAGAFPIRWPAGWRVPSCRKGQSFGSLQALTDWMRPTHVEEDHLLSQSSWT